MLMTQEIEIESEELGSKQDLRSQLKIGSWIPEAGPAKSGKAAIRKHHRLIQASC